MCLGNCTAPLPFRCRLFSAVRAQEEVMKFRCHSGHRLLRCVLGLIWQKVLMRCISPRFEYGLNWAVLSSSAWPLR